MGHFRILAIIPLLLSIFACSSSDDSAPAGGGTPTGVTSGLFVDVEVIGMSYSTATLAGDTDQYGTYFYAPGENITFSIGGVTLGTIAGAPAITPNDFGTGDTIANVARFIQSLDVDNIPTNGIDLTQAAAALAGTTISADAFLVDSATFEANPQIQDAMTAAGKVLIDEATALANLAAGTDSTFDFNELMDNLFVIVDPTNSAVGMIFFESTLAVSIQSTDTTSAGEDGTGAEDSWNVDGSGVLQLVDLAGSGSTTAINRIGGSTEAISVTVSEDGSAPLPAVFVIPETVTTADLGGDGNTVLSKTYDFVDLDSATVSVTFNSDGTYLVNDGSGETGTFQVNFPFPGIVSIVSSATPTEATLMIVMDGTADNVNDKADLLLARVTLIGPGSTDLQFEEIGLGSVTLRSTTP